ncbi:MAG: glucokinase [Deltaproteobacteria bacterium]|nr:glucokinase [Deltaproteobacteria bacterium]
MLLAGDIGGTKTVLAVFSPEMGPRKPLMEAVYRSADYSNLEEISADFLGKAGFSVHRASFGVAGPVIRGKASVTNLRWNLDKDYLSRRLRIPEVHLLNDLEAMAYALPDTAPSDLRRLNMGTPEPRGTMAVIAPGTGLGEAFLTWDGKRYKAFPSEGGHGDFAPNTPLEGELLKNLQGKMDHVSLETVCSGRGIPNIYGFLKEAGFGEEPPWLSERIQAADDPTPVIMNTALDDFQTSPLCTKAVEMFVSILGAAAGNLALTVMSTRGVFLGGGIPPRILAALQNGRFMESFARKGRMGAFLKKIPVHVILNPKLALVGAACFGMEVKITP